MRRKIFDSARFVPSAESSGQGFSSHLPCPASSQHDALDYRLGASLRSLCSNSSFASPISSRILRCYVVEQHRATVVVREVVLEIAVEIHFVPSCAIISPRAVTQISFIPIVPVLFEGVFVHAVSEPRSLLQPQQLALRKLIGIFIEGQFGRPRDIALPPTNFEPHIPSATAM